MVPIQVETFLQVRKKPTSKIADGIPVKRQKVEMSGAITEKDYSEQMFAKEKEDQEKEKKKKGKASMNKIGTSKSVKKTLKTTKITGKPRQKPKGSTRKLYQ